MATISVQVDDLTGEQATDITTVPFSFGGEDYEIDLTTANEQEFADVVAKYIGAARKARRNGNGRPKASDVDSQDVRRWCMKHKIKVGSTGMLPNRIIEAYKSDDPNAPGLEYTEPRPLVDTLTDELPAEGSDEEKAAALHWWNVTLGRKHQDEASPMMLGQYRKAMREGQDA